MLHLGELLARMRIVACKDKAKAIEKRSIDCLFFLRNLRICC